MPAGPIITLSLFDRLTDSNLRGLGEARGNEWDLLAAYKAGIAADLTRLLNTRIETNSIPEKFKLARSSVAAFGVQDYSRSPVEREEVRKSIERAIRAFEPRIKNPQVRLAEGGPLELVFHIHAVIKLGAGGEQVSFKAELPKATRRFNVSRSD